MQNFRLQLLDLGYALSKVYAQNEYGTTTSVQDHVTDSEMYSRFCKVCLFQPQTEVTNLDFVCFSVLQLVNPIVPEAVPTIQSEKHFEQTLWTLQAIIRCFVSPAYSTNGKAALRCLCSPLCIKTCQYNKCVFAPLSAIV